MDRDEVVARLEEMREAALSRQARLEKRVGHREEALPADFSEQAVELQNQETMEQLVGQVQEELSAIRVALERIENESYEDCTQCSKGIESDRLHALPTTTLCSVCAQNQAQN